MPHILAHSIEIVTTALAVAGIGYFLASMIAARSFLRGRRRAPGVAFAPPVSILKSLKGLDTGMMDAFRSHCRQNYTGEFELLFGVSSPDDPAAAAVEQLIAEFPERAIQLVVCPERLGTNGKVSTLLQLAPHVRHDTRHDTRHDILLINDSDITVGPHYLEEIVRCFAPTAQDAGKPPVGLVTALFRGRAHGTLASRLEALAISTDFIAGVLMSNLIERGLHYGLGSTLAVRRDALEKSGGLVALVNLLADDFEMGARVERAGYRVLLGTEIVETSVPAYTWRGFFDHQVRWMRTVRDARPAGYAGLIFTYGLMWALLNVLASGCSPLSLWLLGMSFFLRLAQAMMVGATVLGDHEVLPNLWLLPFRDAVAMGLWVAGFAGDTILWRGERFALKNGKLLKAERS
jgi:ceramide glucosyltransferase